MQCQRAAAFFWLDGDPQAEQSAKLALERHGVGIPLRPRCRARRRGAALDEPLGGPDVEAATHDFGSQSHRVRRSEQSARVAGRKLAVVEAAAYRPRLGSLAYWDDNGDLIRNRRVDVNFRACCSNRHDNGIPG